MLIAWPFVCICVTCWYFLRRSICAYCMAICMYLCYLLVFFAPFYMCLLHGHLYVSVLPVGIFCAILYVLIAWPFVCICVTSWYTVTLIFAVCLGSFNTIILSSNVLTTMPPLSPYYEVTRERIQPSSLITSLIPHDVTMLCRFSLCSCCYSAMVPLRLFYLLQIVRLLTLCY